MSGYIERDDVAQHAIVNAKATAKELAEIERLTSPPAEKKFSEEVERLAKLNDEKNGKPLTAKGRPKFSDTARVRHAYQILRGED